MLSEPMMPGVDRQTRRLLERMGVEVTEVPGVEQVVIKSETKEIVIKAPSVAEMKAKNTRSFQITGGEVAVRERQTEKPKYSEEDVMLVAQQANMPLEKARIALDSADGDLAKAILSLTSN